MYYFLIHDLTSSNPDTCKKGCADWTTEAQGFGWDSEPVPTKNLQKFIYCKLFFTILNERERKRVTIEHSLLIILHKFYKL